MQSDILIALLGMLGSAIGAFSGFRLAVYRIGQLEKKVDEHNNVIKRTFVLEEQMKVANHRLDDLERHEEQRVVRAK